MMITRVTRMVNPRPTQRNAHMLTLGFLNPKGERSNMAKTKRRASRPRHASARNRRHPAVRHNRRHNPHRRRNPIRAGHRRRRNPQFLGGSVKPMKMVELVAGGLVGLGVNNLVMTALPATLTGNAFGAVASSVAIALASGYAGGFVDKEFGAAVAFGGLMAAGQLAINQWIPSVGSSIGLTGLRDFVPGRFPVPQTPVVLSSGGPMGGGVTSAYPAAYAIAA